MALSLRNSGAIFNILMSAQLRLEKVKLINGYKNILGRPGYRKIKLLGPKTIR